MTRIWGHLFVAKETVELNKITHYIPTFFILYISFCLLQLVSFSSLVDSPPDYHHLPPPSPCRDARLGTVRSSPLLRVSDGSFYWERVKWLRMSASVYIPQWCVPDEGAPLTRIRVSESTWSRHRKHSSTRYVPLKVSSNVPRCVCGLRHGSPVSFVDGTGSAVSL